MMIKLSPMYKGLVTGILMVATSLILIYTKQPASTPFQYLVYVFYAGGITWTLIGYSRSDNYNPSFGSIFGVGFRCFIMIVLIVVAYTAIYYSSHPEIAEEAAKYYREDLVKEGNKTPAEIDTMVSTARSQYLTSMISRTIFGTLITGAFFTALGAGLLLMRRR